MKFPVEDPLKTFSMTAGSFSKNPLGIIALFIVLVYGFASLTIAFNSNLAPSERIPIIYFLVIFPVLVLAVFTYLVSVHSGKLFSPADFRNDDNFLKAQQKVVVRALVAASSKEGSGGVAEAEIKELVSSTGKLSQETATAASGWKKQILWVDDRPENNVFERRAFEAVGLTFTLSLNTEDALRHLQYQKFSVVISDMGRKEGPREGYALLKAMRSRGDTTPVFFYAGSNSPEHVSETIRNGGQGTTNIPSELFRMVTDSVSKRATELA